MNYDITYYHTRPHTAPTAMWQISLTILLLAHVGKSNENNLHLPLKNVPSRMRTILQQAAEAVRNLVPQQKYLGWKQDMLVETRLLVNKFSKMYGLQPTTHNKRDIKEESIVQDYTGVHQLQGLEKIHSTSAKFPTDINIFALKKNGTENWYVVALEAQDKKSKFAHMLTIYKYIISSSSFQPEITVSVQEAIDVEVFEIDGNHYLAVAEYTAGNKPLEGSSVYKIMYNNETENISLQFVQTLNTKYPWDITVWERMNQIFLAVAQSTDIMESSSHSLVFQWLGQHFDLICIVPTSDARQVRSFSTGSSMYLAFANNQPRLGYAEAYSEIFKYNFHEHKYVSHQKIRTFGATAVHIFYIQNEKKFETFMIIANAYTTDEQENYDYYSQSIIYKFVDDYFVPFQSLDIPAVTQWESILSSKGEFVLIGASKLYGLKPVQYNGWRFIEMDIKLVDNSIEKGIVKLRSLTFLNKKVLVVTSKFNDGRQGDILELQFSHENVMEQFHQDVKEWCTSSVRNVEQLDTRELLLELETAPKLQTLFLEIDGDMNLTSLTAAELKTQELKTHKGDINSGTISTLNQLHSHTIKINEDMVDITKDASKAVKMNQDLIVHGNLILNNVSFNNPINSHFGKYVQIRNINGQKFDDFLKNIVDVRTEMIYPGSLKFEHISILNGTAGSINEISIKDLVSKDRDTDLEYTLLVYGNVQVEAGATILGHIEGLKESTVINNGTLHMPKLDVQNLEISILNNISVTNTFARGSDHDNQANYFENITANNINIDGLLSGINVVEFEKQYLKNTGDQIFAGPIQFENLIVEDQCNISGHMSGTLIPEDVVLIHEGTIQVEELHFSTVLFANNITVVQSLNNVPINEYGELPLLLLETDKQQYLQGFTVIDNLSLSKDINVQGQIRNIKYNTSESADIGLTVKDDIFIDGSMHLNGKVVFDNTSQIFIHDVVTKNISIMKLLDYGLKLHESKVNVSISLKHSPIKFEDLNTISINETNPENWLHVPKNSETVNIKGIKIFLDNLHFYKPFIVQNLTNGLDLSELHQDIMKITDDQIITGHKVLYEVTAESIEAADTKIGRTEWSNILKANGNQNITGVKIFTRAVFVNENIEVQNMTVLGKITGINIEELLGDSLFHNGNTTEHLLNGNKTFVNFTVIEHFDSPNNHIYTDSISRSDIRSTVTVYEGHAQLQQEVDIIALKFKGTINGIKDEDFGHVWVTTEGKQILKGNHKFHNIAVTNDIKIKSAFINNTNFEHIANEAYYIDENINLHNANFGGRLRVLGNLQLDGKLQEIDIVNDASLLHKNNTIVGTKTFLNTVVLHNVNLHREIAGWNIKQACHLINANKPGCVHVNGTAYMEHEPKVTKYLNGYDIEGINNNIWLADKDSIITGYMDFELLKFEDKIQVQGQLVDVNLNWLRNHYFSKSSSQEIKAKISFVDEVSFNKDVYSHVAKIGENIGNIKIQEFNNRVLKDGPDQKVIELLDFNNLSTENNIELSSFLNDHNLDQDFMLLNKDTAEVKGHTILHGLNCKHIHLNPGDTIQEVEVSNWFKKAVKTKGDFAIKGIKSLNDSELRIMKVAGIVGKQPISSQTVLTKANNQEITGRKTFVKEKSALPLTIKRLNVSGQINEVDFDNFCNNIAYKNGNIQFTSEKNISGLVHTKYAHIQRKYQEVNISLLYPESLKGVNMKEIESTFHHLMEAVRIAENSLNKQATYLSHYKIVQTFPRAIEAILPIYVTNQEISLILLTPTIIDNEVNVDIFSWNNNSEKFVPALGHSRRTTLTPYYVSYKLNGNNMLTCNLPECRPQKILTKLSSMCPCQKVTALNIQEKSCALLLNITDAQLITNTKIYCEDNLDNNSLEIFQEFPFQNSIQQATVLHINRISYLIMVHKKRPGHHENSISIWKLQNQKYKKHQILQYVNVINVDATNHRGQQFVAIISGLLQEAVHKGIIHILRFEASSGIFVPWMELKVDAPFSLSFFSLPSGELVLYVLCNNQTSPFLIFTYHGYEGFKEKTRANTVSVPHTLNAFNLGNRHFVTLVGPKEGQILEAKFKGI